MGFMILINVLGDGTCPSSRLSHMDPDHPIFKQEHCSKQVTAKLAYTFSRDVIFHGVFKLCGNIAFQRAKLYFHTTHLTMHCPVDLRLHDRMHLLARDTKWMTLTMQRWKVSSNNCSPQIYIEKYHLKLKNETERSVVKWVVGHIVVFSGRQALDVHR
jgi:hypothetical protein